MPPAHDSNVLSVYHARRPGVPKLFALCHAGLRHHDYFPEALDDDIVPAWGLRTRHDITLYLPPEGNDSPSTTAGPFPTLDEANAYCTRRFGPLHLVWL